MDAARWQQVKSILDQALQVDAKQREQFVTDTCAGDSSLSSEVNEFLGFSEHAENLLPDNGLADFFPESTEVPYKLPERVGPYRILREIGRGGMGIVCLARRDDGVYDRFVALKLIGSGVHHAKFTKLFWRERRILAQLDHPNIARLLDGGTTEAGQPYYVMEFVDGEPLDLYCQKHSLNLRQKLELFIPICSAVSYAHRNLIIHRDLKPANVLVTHEGVPKLLDFGVAKILADEAQTTTTTGMPLTPFYASPEQVRGESLTVASDIYSLGVLLYELLSGRRPYGNRTGTVAAFRAILEEPPLPLRKRTSGVPADLGNVVMTALRKEPERRYSTVDAFCQDLKKFSHGFPVNAAPDRFFYRFGKFAKRNRWAVSVATVALLAFAVSGVIIWREKQSAELRFQQVRQLAHSVVFELDDAIEDLPGSSRARELLITRGLEYLNGLAKNRGQDPALTFELAQAYMKIGGAQGDLQQANVGDREGALSSYGKARALLLDLHKKDPANRDVERSLALVDTDITALSPRARIDQVVPIRREAISLFQDIARTTSGAHALNDVALAHFYLALDLTERQDYREALPIWKTALSDYEEIQKSENNSPQAQRNIALIEKRIAGVYYALDDYTNAVAHNSRAAEIDQARVAAEPQSPTARMDLSFDLVELGSCLHELRDEKQALADLDRAIGLRREVAAEDPHDFRAQSELETVLRMTAVVKTQSGSFDESLNLAREAAEIGASLHGRDPRNTDETVNFALDCLEAGEAYRLVALRAKPAQRQHWEAALNSFQKSQTLAASIPADAFDRGDREKLTELRDKIEECRVHIRG